MYKCVIWSNYRHPAEYMVKTRSAMRAAAELGRCEGGEVVEIRTAKTGRLLSRVLWDQADGGRYVRLCID